MIYIYYKTIPTNELTHPLPHIVTILCVAKSSIVQIYNIALLAIVTMLYIEELFVLLMLIEALFTRAKIWKRP